MLPGKSINATGNKCAQYPHPPKMIDADDLFCFSVNLLCFVWGVGYKTGSQVAQSSLNDLRLLIFQFLTPEDLGTWILASFTVQSLGLKGAGPWVSKQEACWVKLTLEVWQCQGCPGRGWVGGVCSRCWAAELERVYWGIPRWSSVNRFAVGGEEYLRTVLRD